MRALIAVDGGAITGEVLTSVAALLRAGGAVDLLTVIDPSEEHATVSASGPVRIEQPPVRGALGGAVFSTASTPVESVTQAAARIDEEYRQRRESLAAEHLPSSLSCRTHVRQDERPVEAIMSLAAELGVDAIAAGTRAPGHREGGARQRRGGDDPRASPADHDPCHELRPRRAYGARRPAATTGFRWWRSRAVVPASPDRPARARRSSTRSRRG